MNKHINTLAPIFAFEWRDKSLPSFLPCVSHLLLSFFRMFTAHRNVLSVKIYIQPLQLYHK